MKRKKKMHRMIISFVSLRPSIEVEGKQNSMFPTVPVIKCFVIPSNSKVEKTANIVCLMPAGSCCGFKGHNLIMCKLKGQVVVSLGS